MVPFFAINLAMGVVSVRAWTFYWVSQIGMLAGTVVYVNAGTQLARIDWPPFELSVAGVGAFERKGFAHTIWARVPPSDVLEALRQKVERACERAGLGRETRRFAPHVTLARLNRSAGPIGGWLSAWGDLATGPWLVEDFVLYESHLGHEGAHYEAVAVYPLRA